MASAEMALGTGGMVERLLATATTPTGCWPGTGPRAPRKRCSICGTARAIGYDEFVDRDGNVRPAWPELADAVGERGRAGLDRLRSVVRRPGRQRRHHLHRGRSRAATTATAWSPALEPGHAADRAVRGRLGGAGGRAGAAVAPARRRARRPVRAPPPAHRRRPAAAAGVRPSRLRAGRPRHRGARAPPAVHARLRRQPAAGRQLPGQRRLDAGAVGRRLRAGRPARCRARDSRPLRKDRAATDDAVRPGAAAGADRRRTRRRPGPRGGGAQPGHLLRDRVRPGVSGDPAGLPAGGERGPGGARRQAVDALAGHA